MSANALNRYFPTRLCLNLASRPDRWKQASNEFARVGVLVDQFLATPAEDRFLSFNTSQLAMIQEGRRHGVPMLTFEDDAFFRDCSHLEEALSELPWSWGVLYLGANLRDDKPQRYSRHLFHVMNAWTTHAIAYSPAAMDFISANFKPGESGMFDDWISREVLPKFSGYIVAPTVCWQRTGFSDLWDRATDYMPAFQATDDKMQVP